MKIQFLLVLVLILSVFSIGEGSSILTRRRLKPLEDIQDRYQKFLKQHVIKQMKKKGCAEAIRERCTTSNEECKPVNTFIVNSNESDIKKVCKEGQCFKRGTNLMKSVRKFETMVCRKSKGLTQPDCEYNVKYTDVYVVFACEQGLPVHFERSVKMINTTSWYDL